MPDYNKIVRQRQALIRRQMDAQGIMVKQVQLDGGWEEPSTVQSYFPARSDKEPTTMSVAAMYRLLDTGALPADLLSLLLPEGHAIIRVPEGIDLDDLEEVMRDFLATKGRAHHPDSPEGREISDSERAELNAKAARACVRLAA